MGDTANHLVNDGRGDLPRVFRFHHGSNAMRLVSIFRNHYEIWNAGISICLNTLFPALQPGVLIRWTWGAIATVGGSRVDRLNKFIDEGLDVTLISCLAEADSPVTVAIYRVCHDVRLFIVLRDGIPISNDIAAETIPRRDRIPVQTVNRSSGRVGQYVRDSDWRGRMRKDEVTREVEERRGLGVILYSHRKVDFVPKWRVLDLDGLTSPISIQRPDKAIERWCNGEGRRKITAQEGTYSIPADIRSHSVGCAGRNWVRESSKPWCGQGENEFSNDKLSWRSQKGCIVFRRGK